MNGLLISSFAVAAVFALVHLYGGRLKFLRFIPRSRWLSLAGGVAVAYVFVHLLPELGEHQEQVKRELKDQGALAFAEVHVYLWSMMGLLAFYALERAAKGSGRHRNGRSGVRVFALHMASYAVYNALVAYLLLHREEAGWRSFAFYAGAMGMHFLVNDRGLEADHGRLYQSYGRWVLAVAIMIGAAAGALWSFDQLVISLLFAFLAGGVVLNVLKEELPEERESRLSAFAGGALLYTALLLAAY